MAWEIEYTDEFEAWWETLTEDEQVAIAARAKLLEEQGPGLRRPAVGEIKTSENDPRMKELRASAGQSQLRVLFMFDPRSTAILLIGGNKTGKWNAWYRAAIPRADRLYATYISELQKEGLI